MHIKDNQTILKIFITKEIEKVYKKYNTITVEEAELVGRFIEKIERNEIDYDPYLDYNNTKALAEALERELETLAENTLEEELEDVEKVMELFDEEEVANMWIFQTSMSSASQQYVRDNGWEEVLGIEDVEEGYVDSNNVQVYYGLNERGEILE